LKEKFLRRVRSFWKSEKGARETSVRVAVERRWAEEVGLDREIFKYEKCEYQQSREAEYWRWMRVHEDCRGKNEQERWERQEKAARKIQERSRLDAKIIKYIW
jgi:hypothetical protein